MLRNFISDVKGKFSGSKRKKRRSSRHGLKQRLTEHANRHVFNWKIRERMYMHIAAGIENRQSPEIALEKFGRKQTKRGRKTPSLIVADAVRRMRNGASLAEALSEWVPSDELGVIEGGEVGAKLPAVLPKLVFIKRQVIEIQRMFRATMVEPAIYFAACYLVLWFFGTYVTPTLTLVHPASKATGVLSAMYSVSSFASSLWALIPPLIICMLGVALVYALPRWTGKYRVKAEQYFPFSYYRDIQGCLWMSAFSVMFEAGVADVKILASQLRYASPWLAERLRSIGLNMGNGAELHEAMSARTKGMPSFDFPNPDVIDDIESYSGHSGLAQRLEGIVERWTADIKYETQTRVKRYGFYATAFMYVLMGLLAWAINGISTQMSNVPGAI